MIVDKDTKHPFLGVQAIRSDLGPVFFLRSRSSSMSISLTIDRINIKPVKCASLEAVEKKFIKSALKLKVFEYHKDDVYRNLLKASNDIARLALRGKGKTLIVNPKQTFSDMKLEDARYKVITNPNVPLKTGILLYSGPNAFDHVVMYTPRVDEKNEVISHGYTEITEYFEKYVRVIKLE